MRLAGRGFAIIIVPLTTYRTSSAAKIVRNSSEWRNDPCGGSPNMSWWIFAEETYSQSWTSPDASSPHV